MRNALARTVAAIDAVNDAIGRAVAWLSAVLVLVTCLVVALRYGFGIGQVALQESMRYLHAALFLLAAAYTLHTDGHVRVDIFYRGWSEMRRRWVDLLGSLLLLLPFSVFLFASSFGYVADSWARGETSPEAGGLPFVYLLKSLILVVAVQLAAAALARAGGAALALSDPESS